MLARGGAGLTGPAMAGGAPPAELTSVILGPVGPGPVLISASVSTSVVIFYVKLTG
jgi:hypothetical protein